MMQHLPLYEHFISLMRQAGKIILEAHNANVNESITEKSGTANFVTAFDVRVQEFLINGIKALEPCPRTT